MYTLITSLYFYDPPSQSQRTEAERSYNPYPYPAEHADCSVSEMRLMIIPHLFMRAIFWLNSVSTSMHLERAKTNNVLGCCNRLYTTLDSGLRLRPQDLRIRRRQKNKEERERSRRYQYHFLANHFLFREEDHVTEIWLGQGHLRVITYKSIQISPDGTYVK